MTSSSENLSVLDCFFSSSGNFLSSVQCKPRYGGTDRAAGVYLRYHWNELAETQTNLGFMFLVTFSFAISWIGALLVLLGKDGPHSRRS